VIAAVVEPGEYPDAIFMQKNNLSHYNFSPEYNTATKNGFLSGLVKWPVVLGLKKQTRNDKRRQI
jgi:hypothetical protein